MRVRAAWLLLAVWLAPPLAAAAPAAQVLFTQGAVSARSAGGEARLLGRGAAVSAGDTITTGSRSFILLKFNDGSKLTLRPDTVFAVEEYAHDRGTEFALFRLIRGGLRAITGLISKRNPDAYRIKTPVATLGIRGTEFDARLCEADCAAEASTASAPPTAAPVPVARVAFTRGRLRAVDAVGADRLLAAGGPVYPGDMLITGPRAFAVIAFRDGSRFTLQPATEFVVQDYVYDADRPGRNSALFNLIRGGLRALTGAIGRLNPSGFKVRTPTATLGIRGTGFDIYYRNPTWWSVWRGSVDITAGTAELVVETGQHAYLAGAGGSLARLAQLPDFLLQLPGPRPDKVPVDVRKLFGAVAVDPARAGLYVTVYDGHVRLTKAAQVVDLGRSESGFADSRELLRLDATPGFVIEDFIPRPGRIDPRMLQLMGLIKQDVPPTRGQECEVR